eukprot:m.206615 g.206615  ORF g.206615 m.206615 type:complete len:120 (-) comp25359_c2_seq4:2426-2785(-)
MAPEVLRHSRIQEEDAAALDVYSFGVVLWECWARARPWDEITVTESQFPARLCELVNSGVRPKLPHNCGDAPDGYNDVMNACWAGKPEHRPTFEAAATSLDRVRTHLARGSQKVEQSAL